MFSTFRKGEGAGFFSASVTDYLKSFLICFLNLEAMTPVGLDNSRKELKKRAYVLPNYLANVVFPSARMGGQPKETVPNPSTQAHGSPKAGSRSPSHHFTNDEELKRTMPQQRAWDEGPSDDAIECVPAETTNRRVRRA